MGGWWLVVCRRYDFSVLVCVFGGWEMTDAVVGTCAVEAG